MVVSGMESKRQRHPNVRLGDVGEIPAPFSGILRRSKVNLDSKRQRLGNKKPGEVCMRSASGLSSPRPEFTSIGSTETHKFEDNYPHSLNRYMKGTSSDEVSACKPRLGVGSLAPKVRATKRGRSVRCSGVMGSSWYSGVSPRIGFGEQKAYRYDTDENSMSDNNADVSSAECSGTMTSNPSKASQQDDLSSDNPKPMSDWKETPVDDEDNCKGIMDEMVYVTVVDNIKVWLEDLGFGQYARVFDMHGVDGEVLPLLTFEDLKEMGIDAVGCRRKIFHAIQLLNGFSA